MTAACPVVYDTDLENVYLVWLDALVETATENIATQQEFRTIIHQFKTFPSVDVCEQYLQKRSKYDRIILIVSGRLGQVLVPRVHQWRQIYCIYVYCQDKQRNEEWAKNFNKVKGVLNQLNVLIDRVKTDHTKRLQSQVDEPFPINISKTNNLSDSSVDNDFFHSQLLIDYLNQMRTISTDMTELTNICLNEYYRDENQLLIIQDFQRTYNPNQVLWWYTRDSCIYRLLTKALSIKNLDLLFYFGFMIRDVRESLQKFRLTSTTSVYHGQIMSLDEFDTFKKSMEHYISVNTFLKANCDRKQIINHLNEFPITKDFVRVIFEINADPKIASNKPFANITPFTYLPQEQQVLFMLGSVFRIMDVSQDKKNSIWIVKLTLSTTIKDYDETHLASGGHLLHKMGRNEEAEKYFIRLLKEIPSDHEDVCNCYYTLGLISFLKNNYNSSIHWYQKLLQHLPLDNPHLPDGYYAIACVYQSLYDYTEALKYYNQALTIWSETYGDDLPLQVAECLNNMGCIYEVEKIYSQALKYHQQALSIRDKFQVDLGSSYNNIGNIYLSIGEYNAAIENYTFSLKEKSKTVSLDDPSLGTTLRNIGIAYEEDGNFSESLKYYKRAETAFKQLLSSSNIYDIEIQEDIQRVSLFLESEERKSHLDTKI